MAYQEQQSGDIRATLAISQAEAISGTSRTLNLPDGRRVVVPVPAGTRDGQEIPLVGQGQPIGYSGSRGALILTIAVAPAENFGLQTFPQQGTDNPTEFLQSLPPPPPPPPTAAALDYPSIGQAGTFTKYPAAEQGTFYTDRTQQASAQKPSYEAPQPQYPAPQKPQRRRGLSAGVIALIIVLLLLLIGGSGLIYYTAVLRPNQQNAQATSTVIANVTGTAQAIAAQTAQTNAKMTATALSQANATATVEARATVQAQATAAALQNIYTQATSGTPVINDSMTQQDLNTWEVDDKSGGGGCAFKGGSYHASMPQAGFFSSCYAQSSNFSNFAFQVEMTILKGDRGGIIFRSDGSSKFYLFRIDQNGTYDLFLYVDGTGTNSKNLLEGSSPAIHTGINQMNKVTVVARNNNLYLYVNRQYIGGANDGSYSSGSIAVFAEDHTNSTEVAFSKVEVWKL